VTNTATPTIRLDATPSRLSDQCPTSIFPPIFMPNALSAAALPIYHGLGQAQNNAGLHAQCLDNAGTHSVSSIPCCHSSNVEQFASSCPNCTYYSPHSDVQNVHTVPRHNTVQDMASHFSLHSKAKGSLIYSMEPKPRPIQCLPFLSCYEQRQQTRKM